jgi:hypothetical protein
MLGFVIGLIVGDLCGFFTFMFIFSRKDHSGGADK